MGRSALRHLVTPGQGQGGIHALRLLIGREERQRGLVIGGRRGGWRCHFLFQSLSSSLERDLDLGERVLEARDLVLHGLLFGLVSQFVFIELFLKWQT